MPRGDRSSTTRETLLKAGAKVFVRRSLQGATVREIVEEAGLTIPVLYYHFAGKDELYAEVIRHGREEFRRMIETALAEDGDAIACLRRVVAGYVRFGREDTVRLRLLFSEIFRSPGSSELDQGAAELNTWTRESLRRLMAKADAAGDLRIPSPEIAERVFVGLLVGLMYEQANEPEAPVLFDALADHVMRTFCSGISVPAPASDRRPTPIRPLKVPGGARRGASKRQSRS